MIPAARFTPREREWVLDSVLGSQALAGVFIERAPLVDITEGPMPDIADRRIFQSSPQVSAIGPSRARSYLRAQRLAQLRRDTSRPVLDDDEIAAIVAALLRGAQITGADFGIAFAQFCVETNGGLFGGQVPIAAHNPAGIGAVNDGASYIVFPDWAIGILAYWLHLLAWCDRMDLALALSGQDPVTIDPRIPIVKQVRASKGRALTWRDLGGRWAVRDGVPWDQQATMTDPPNYGAIIASRHAAILATPDTEGATPVSSTTTIKLALASGHHNSSGGDPLEYQQTGELCEAIARHAAPLGFDVRVVQPDGPDADSDPGDGTIAGSLDVVGNTVVAWANQGWRADCFIETHTEGGGGSGGFAIYPDWDSDVDTEVRDVLGPLLARAVSAATGLGLGAGGDGVMSETQTGVGGQGFRLGIFRTTEPIKAFCTRLIFEFGAHDKEPDKTIQARPAFYDQCGRAVAQALAEHYGLTISNATTPAAGDAERASLIAFAEAIPFGQRGVIEWEGTVDLSGPDFGGGAAEHVAKYERIVAHRYKGGNYLLTLKLWDRLRREGKIRQWPSGAAVALGEG